jgi:hypothetical protein
MATAGLSTVFAVTIVLPLLVVIVDYVYRIDSNLLDIMRSAGPDLCLLGLGAVGTIFVDPKVAATIPLPPIVAGLIVTFIIFMLRGICFRLQQSTSGKAAVATMMTGLMSITIVGCILMYSYWGR